MLVSFSQSTMPRVAIFNPRRPMFCYSCGELLPGVIIRKEGDLRFKVFICGRCLALAMQDITKMNWLSQWIMWNENSKLGKIIRGEIDERS